jgi:hypothetical protein
MASSEFKCCVCLAGSYPEAAGCFCNETLTTLRICLTGICPKNAHAHRDYHEATSHTSSCKGDLAHVDMKHAVSLSDALPAVTTTQVKPMLAVTAAHHAKFCLTNAMPLHKTTTDSHCTRAALNIIKAITTFPRSKEQQLYLE